VSHHRDPPGHFVYLLPTAAAFSSQASLVPSVVAPSVSTTYTQPQATVLLEAAELQPPVPVTTAAQAAGAAAVHTADVTLTDLSENCPVWHLIVVVAQDLSLLYIFRHPDGGFLDTSRPQVFHQCVRDAFTDVYVAYLAMRELDPQARNPPELGTF
jgi:hypothetical protein